MASEPLALLKERIRLPADFPLIQIPRFFDAIQLDPSLKNRASMLRLWVDRPVTRSNYLAFIAYRPCGIWSQRKFGRRVIAPTCFGLGALSAAAVPLIWKYQDTEHARRQPQDYVKSTCRLLCLVSLIAAIINWTIAIRKRWFDAYPADVTYHIGKGRREIALALTQGKAAVESAIARAMEHNSSLTNILTPAEWGELLLAYASMPSRIDNGTPLANIAEAFRAHAISASRSAAYSAIGAQYKSIQWNHRQTVEDLAAKLHRQLQPFEAERDGVIEEARKRYETSAPVRALQDAEKSREKIEASIRAAQKSRIDLETERYQHRRTTMPRDDAERIHQATLENIEKETELDLRSAQAAYQQSLHVFSAAAEAAQQEMNGRIVQAQRDFAESTTEIQKEHDSQLTAAKESTDALSTALTRKLNSVVRVNCDTEDYKTGFAAPTFSIHSAVPVAFHPELGHFLTGLTTQLNTTANVSQSATIETMRLALNPDLL